MEKHILNQEWRFHLGDYDGARWGDPDFFRLWILIFHMIGALNLIVLRMK